MLSKSLYHTVNCDSVHSCQVKVTLPLMYQGLWIAESTISMCVAPPKTTLLFRMRTHLCVFMFLDSTGKHEQTLMKM